MELRKVDEPIKDKLKLATQYAKEGHLDSAIALLKSMIEQWPENEVTRGLLASIYLQIGMQAQAVEHYEILLDTHPENSLARFQLGMAKLSQGKPEEALDVWEPMLSLKNEFMANFHSALALLQLNRPQEALQRLLEAKQKMPASHPFYPQLMKLHDQLTA